MAVGEVGILYAIVSFLNQILNEKRADSIRPYDQVMPLPTVGEDIILPRLGEILIDKLGFIGEIG